MRKARSEFGICNKIYVIIWGDKFQTLEFIIPIEKFKRQRSQNTGSKETAKLK